MVISHRYVCFCLTHGFFGDLDGYPERIMDTSMPGNHEKVCPKNPSTYMPESAHILYIYIVHVYISKYITILYSCLSLYIYIYVYIYMYIYMHWKLKPHLYLFQSI